MPPPPGLSLYSAGPARIRSPGYAGWGVRAHSGSLSLQDEHSSACTEVGVRHAHPENAPGPEREGAGRISRI